MKFVKNRKAILLILGLVIALIGSSGYLYQKSVNQVHYYDQEFMEAVGRGLEDRWAYADRVRTSTYSKKEYLTMVEKELNHVKDFDAKPFKNDALRVQAIAYIDALNAMHTVVEESYSSNDFDEKWLDAYNTRNEKLAAIDAIEKIKVNKKYTDTLETLLSSGRETMRKNERAVQLKNIIQSFKLSIADDKAADAKTKYSIKATNELDITIKTITIEVVMKDADNNIVDVQTIKTTDWKAGEDKVFEFSTDKSFTAISYNLTYVEYDD